MELLLGLPSVSMLADMLLADMLLADMLGHQFEMQSEKRTKQERISYK